MKKVFKSLLTVLLTAVVTLSILPVPVFADGIRQTYTTGDDSYLPCYASPTNETLGQSFTTTGSYEISSIDLKLYKFGTVTSDLNINLYATSSGLPTGDSLSSGSLSKDVVTTSSAGDWYGVGMSAYTLNATTQYAIVLSTSQAGSSSGYAWRIDATSASFADGVALKGYPTWAEQTGKDFMFSIYSTGASVPLLTVNTVYSSNMTADNITFTGVITDVTGGNATARGFEWVAVSGLYPDWGEADSNTEEGNFSTGTYSLTCDVDLEAGNSFWYRAIATNTEGTGYSSYKYGIYVSSPSVQTISASSQTVEGLVVAVFTGNIADAGDGSGYVDVRGFDIGTSSGNYDAGLQIYEPISASWNGTVDYYSQQIAYLSPSTLYYYRAFAIRYDAGGVSSVGYGTEKSFTTSAYSTTPPTIQILGAMIVNDNQLNVDFTVVSSPSAPISQAGIRYGTGESSTNVTWYTDFNMTSAPSVGQTAQMALYFNPNLEWGSILWLQAKAVDIASNIGYSSIVGFDLEDLQTGAGGISITNTSSVVYGNTVTLYAQITNPANVAIDRYVFSFGTTTSASNRRHEEQLTGTIPPTVINMYFTELAEETTYYFKAGIYVQGRWIYSSIDTFTTETAVPILSRELPVVITGLATDITGNSFKGNGNLTSEGTSNVTQLGFAYAFVNDWKPENWARSLVTDSYETGAYSQVLYFTKTNVRVFYCAIAVNSQGTGYGGVYYCDLGGTVTNTTNITGSAGTSSGITGWLTNWLQPYGLANTVGKWLVTIILMVIVFIAFREIKWLATVGASMVLGLAIISGFVEQWWIILLFAIVAGGLFLIAWRKTQ